MDGVHIASVTDSLIAPRAQTLLRFFTCGSVDDGKSTLIGRLLYDTESIFEDQIEALERDSKKFGTTGSNLDFALLMDGLSAEREQGITIDVSYRYFSSQRRTFIVADTPGHEQYTRNMATGASTAEVAIILVDARKGIRRQTLRHSYILSMLGVRDIVLAVNKMDLVNFNEDVFKDIVDTYHELTRNLGFTNIVSIPLSARDGDNVTAKSVRMPWYDGMSLLDHLDTVKPAITNAETSFVMPVQWVNRPNLDFRGYAGTIAAGSISRGEKVVVLPNQNFSHVVDIIGPDGARDRALAGEAVTVTLSDDIDVSRGDVLATETHNFQPRRNLEARLLWMIDEPMSAGDSYIIQLATGTANARISSINHQIDVENFQPIPTQFLKLNQVGLVSLTCDKELVFTDYQKNRDLGAFILVDRFTNQTAALGVVEPIADMTPVSAYGKIFSMKPLSRIKTLEFACSVVLAAGVYSLTENLWAFSAVIFMDFILRPLLRN